MGPKSRSGPVGSGWLSQTSPIPRSPDGDNKCRYMSVRIFLRTVIGAFLLGRKPSSFFRLKEQDLANNEEEAEHYFAVDAKRVCLLWLQLYTVMVSLCFV